MEKQKIHLVVTDIAMPLMDGIQLIREIRKRYKKVYIIVLSGQDLMITTTFQKCLKK